MPIISHPSFNGPQEVEPFRARGGQAGIDERTLFGIAKYTSPDGAPDIYLLGSQFVSPKTVLRRSMRQNAAGDGWESDGSGWAIVSGGYASLVGAAQVRTTTREASAPGANMRTPAGLLIVDESGTPIPQPASGEPARDPWTGELTGETQP